MVDRANPGFTTDEHTMLAAWLDFYRATVLMKCEGLDDEQLRTASAPPPSPLTLLGLLQHLAEVERNWFRRVLAGGGHRPDLLHRGRRVRPRRGGLRGVRRLVVP